MKKPLRIGILAGEMSGDILGAGLMTEIQSRHPDATFVGIGGEKMLAAGVNSLFPMERLSVMGLIDPLKRLPELLRIRRQLARYFRDNPPDVFIGIDSPDFCLGLERKLRRLNIPTVHYVSPSVWAWRRSRLHTIRKSVDLMLTLFPFEEAFYKDHDVPVNFVGHPLADEFPIKADTLTARLELGIADDEKVLALLPGSRQGEVSRLARSFLDTAEILQISGEISTVLISAAGPQRQKELEELLAQHYKGLDVRLITGNSRTVMSAADILLVASGTVTLEALLLKKPMVVCYRMAALSYAVISRLLKVPYFSLPNLLAGEPLVPELVQNQVKPDELLPAVRGILNQPDQLLRLTERFSGIHQTLRRNASSRAADAVLQLIWSNN